MTETAPKSRMPKRDRARQIVRPLVQAGKPVNAHKLQEKHGISHVLFDMAVAAEYARREVLDVEPPIDASTLSLSAQKKLSGAIRRYERKLDREYEAKVLIDAQAMARELLGSTLAYFDDKVGHAEEVIRSRHGVMDRSQYRRILARLHPDAGGSTEDFIAFAKMERILVCEREYPTTFTTLPTTEELMERAKQLA